MTQSQKEQIDTLREQGNGYKRIAGILGVSVIQSPLIAGEKQQCVLVVVLL